MSLDTTSLRQAIRENFAEPEGAARNARAERIFAEIEQLGDTALVIDGLNHLMQIYNYSAEADKMFVPFARILRMWDERPGDFDGRQVHTLFWMFKWVSSGMIDQPHIPLASIEKWQTEMERRYRLAGHSERAVRQSELRIALHLGDMERGERAYAAWQAADRDDKSDCRACELHAQGAWQARAGGDDQALDAWRPVIEGEFVCAQEPDSVLGSSLLPLLRLGRTDEARANHLRGYRLVRSQDSMRDAVADHVEFCALTGNEARGLEILAERPAYFTDTGDPNTLLDFLAVTALLTDRLTALGHGDQSLAGPGGRSWTAAELAAHARKEALALAARFDERNGNSRTSDTTRERMDREPLLDRLPLGLRPARPAAGTAAKAAAAKAAAVETAADLGSLLAEARRLSDAQRPDALEAWAAVARAAGRDGVQLDAHDLGEIDEHRAMDRRVPAAEAMVLFRSAAERYESVGEAGHAVAARARAAYALCIDAGEHFEERSAEALAELAGARDEVLALHADGAATARQVSRVLLCRARILNDRVHQAEDTDAAVAALEESVRELLDFAEPHRAAKDGADRTDGADGADGGVGGVGIAVGEALGFLGDIVGYRGSAEQAAEMYARAADAYISAGRPWYAVEAESQLAGVSRHLGDLETAERASRAALEHAREFAAPGGLSRLHLQLVESLADSGKTAEAAEHALEAAHWADEAGESAGTGAYARHRLGGFLLELGRTEESAAVLEAVLPDLKADEHGEGMIVQTLWWLGDCMTVLYEPRTAAEHWLKAADIARGWPEQQDHAMLANLAGQALYRADLNSEAELAYRRSGELWRDLGDVHALVRTLRVRAWIAVRDGQAGPEAARELMASAAAECEKALASVADPEAQERLREELTDTQRQTAELIADEGEA
ncbi:tetratricopeptide repeat protein [Streptomyces sp. NPDC020681]|uniref:tetratricopeptide repeat protein n=1 Tax=Streptomyces sp. NPDC020681 TaxID=3365083 RepID=UPI00378A45B1